MPKLLRQTYLTQVHTMVSELRHRQEATSSSSPRPRMTKLSAIARKGDTRVEVKSPEVSRIGEVVIVGGQSIMVVWYFGFLWKGTTRKGPWTVVRPLQDNEFLQAEGERLCLYRRGKEDDVHFICYVGLIKRSTPERGDIPDEAQDRPYAEDLDELIQRIIDARVATLASGSGGGGVTIPPLSSAHEWERPPRTRQRTFLTLDKEVVATLTEKVPVKLNEFQENGLRVSKAI